MPTHIPGFVRKGGLLSALIAAIFAPQAFAVPAGKVDFSIGKVSATGTDGVARDLVKGAEINPGDSIATNDGRVQIRFTDGAYMSLQPNTVFKVENYAFAGKSDGSEKGVFSLITGGLRTISGLIGKGKRENYELRTKTATIGIRGTSYSANQTEDTLTVTVGDGLISVSNQSGSLILGGGQSAVVRSPQARSEMTNEKALAPKGSGPKSEDKQPPAERVAAAGEQRSPIGISDPINRLVTSPTPTPVPTPVPTPTPTPPALVSGAGYTVAYGFLRNDTPSPTLGSHVEYDANATFDAGQTLTKFDNGGLGTVDFTAGAAAASPETGSDGLIGWGRWTGTVGGTLSGAGGLNYSPTEGVHYVTGMPTLISVLPTTGAVATYSLLGATKPTSNVSGASSAGTLSGNLSITFNATPLMVMNVNIVNGTAGISYNLANFGSLPLSFIAGTQAVFTANAFSTNAIGACGGTLNVKGFFAGANGERIGVAYDIAEALSGKTTAGAAAFKK